MQKRVMWILTMLVFACAPVAWAAPASQPPPKPQPMGGQPPIRIVIPILPFGGTLILVIYSDGTTEFEIPCPPEPPGPIGPLA